jgi:acyl carrier protein
MTRDELATAVRQAIGATIPEADPASLNPASPIRDQLDMDSMDFINFVIELDKALHLAVPEADYGQLTSIDSCVEYLEGMQAGQGGRRDLPAGA